MTNPTLLDTPDDIPAKKPLYGIAVVRFVFVAMGLYYLNEVGRHLVTYRINIETFTFTVGWCMLALMLGTVYYQATQAFYDLSTTSKPYVKRKLRTLSIILQMFFFLGALSGISINSSRFQINALQTNHLVVIGMMVVTLITAPVLIFTDLRLAIRNRKRKKA